MDVLVDMTTHVPPGTHPGEVDDIRARESVRARELVADGHLLRLWRPPLTPGQWRTFGLFAADDSDQLEQGRQSFQTDLDAWMGLTMSTDFPADKQ